MLRKLSTLTLLFALLAVAAIAGTQRTVAQSADAAADSSQPLQICLQDSWGGTIKLTDQNSVSGQAANGDFWLGAEDYTAPGSACSYEVAAIGFEDGPFSISLTPTDSCSRAAVLQGDLDGTDGNFVYRSSTGAYGSVTIEQVDCSLLASHDTQSFDTLTDPFEAPAAAQDSAASANVFVCVEEIIEEESLVFEYGLERVGATATLYGTSATPGCTQDILGLYRQTDGKLTFLQYDNFGDGCDEPNVLHSGAWDEAEGIAYTSWMRTASGFGSPFGEFHRTSCIPSG